MHVGPKVEPGLVPHVGGPIIRGASNVFICGRQAARVADTASCVGPLDTIEVGEPTVLIEGKPAVRMGDLTAHGGLITSGCPTVLIGMAILATQMARATRQPTPEEIQEIQEALNVG